MKRVILGAALLASLALLATPASAQVGQVRGKVVGPEGEVIPDATVLIEYQGGITRKLEVKTNKKGEYLQVGLEPGPYRLTATKEGYRGAVADIRVSLGQPTDVPDLELLTPQAAAAQPGSEQAELREKFAAAVELTRAGKVDEAEAAFKVLLEKFPDIPEIHQNLGVVYAQKKDWAAAEAAYLKALELRPGDPGITTALAAVYQESGQSEKAMQTINEAAGSNPDDAKAQFNKGVFLLNAGQTAEAIAAFEGALALDPAMAEAHYHAGTLLVGQGKVPEAIQHLEAYLALDPQNAQNVATAKGLLQALKK
jgi:tetratricopeptide (TPR) repeat protein